MNFLSQLSRSLELEGNVHESNSNFIDLSTIKSPYAPSPKVGEVLLSLDLSKLNNYADWDEYSLKDAIAIKFNLESDNIFLHNSCDDILSLCFKAFFDPNDKIVFPDVTSSFYKKCAKVNNIGYETISVTQDMKIHLSDYENLNCRGILLCNPNVPTGYTINKLELVDFIKAHEETLFIIDERFVEYSNTSLVNFIPNLDNVIILRSLAYAYGLAGIRCGYAIASKELIKGLNYIHKCISRYPLDCVTQKVAEACIEDDKYLLETVDKVIATRDDFSDKMRALGFEVLPSSTNFIFCKHENMNASEIEFLLRENGIKVRHYKNKKIDNYLRITIGTKEEMDLLLKQVKKFLKNVK